MTPHCCLAQEEPVAGPMPAGFSAAADLERFSEDSPLTVRPTSVPSTGRPSLDEGPGVAGADEVGPLELALSTKRLSFDLEAHAAASARLTNAYSWPAPHSQPRSKPARPAGEATSATHRANSVALPKIDSLVRPGTLDQATSTPAADDMAEEAEAACSLTAELLAGEHGVAVATIGDRLTPRLQHEGLGRRHSEALPAYVAVAGAMLPTPVWAGPLPQQQGMLRQKDSTLSSTSSNMSTPFSSVQGKRCCSRCAPTVRARWLAPGAVPRVSTCPSCSSTAARPPDPLCCGPRATPLGLRTEQLQFPSCTLLVLADGLGSEQLPEDSERPPLPRHGSGGQQQQQQQQPPPEDSELPPLPRHGSWGRQQQQPPPEDSELPPLPRHGSGGRQQQQRPEDSELPSLSRKGSVGSQPQQLQQPPDDSELPSPAIPTMSRSSIDLLLDPNLVLAQVAGIRRARASIDDRALFRSGLLPERMPQMPRVETIDPGFPHVISAAMMRDLADSSVTVVVEAGVAPSAPLGAPGVPAGYTASAWASSVVDQHQKLGALGTSEASSGSPPPETLLDPDIHDVFGAHAAAALPSAPLFQGAAGAAGGAGAWPSLAVPFWAGPGSSGAPPSPFAEGTPRKETAMLLEPSTVHGQHSVTVHDPQCIVPSYNFLRQRQLAKAKLASQSTAGYIAEAKRVLSAAVNTADPGEAATVETR